MVEDNQLMQKKATSLALLAAFALGGVAHADITPAGTIGPSWAVTATQLGITGFIALLAGVYLLRYPFRGT